MKFWIYLGAVFIGVLLGGVLFNGSSEDENRKVLDELPGGGAGNGSVRGQVSAGVRARYMITAASPAMDHNVPVNKAMDILFKKRKSPMRTRAFLKTRIQHMTKGQLNQAFLNGEIQTKAEIIEGARRLMLEDPDLTWSNFLKVYEYNKMSGYQLDGLGNRFAFSDTMLQVATDTEEGAIAMMKRLQAMGRNGKQRYLSLWHTRYWAEKDPAAAARRFDELVYLRSIQSHDYNPDTFAELLVTSWVKKDEEGMRNYIDELPAGKQRTAMKEALEKLDAKE